MSRKVIILTSLIAILLTACSGDTPAATVATTQPATETKPATLTQAPTETEISTDTPTTTSTPETPIPTNPPDCTNQAAFVIDVTIPDNSPVETGSIFTKTWRIKNTGTCVWTPDYKLTHYSEERLGAPEALPLAVTYPGQTADVSVALTAPGGLGSHRGNFVIKNPAGLIMKIDNDSRLWVLINVIASSGATTPATPGTPAGGPTSGANPTTPASTSTGGGSGFANVTCAFTLDSARVAEVINAINAYRAQNGLAPYNVNSQLTQAAQSHANDMACNNLFFHTGSNGSTPQSRVAASGYAASNVTENVYGSYPPLNGQGAVNWWINDRTDIRHNQNLLSATYVDIGVGYSFYNNFGYYVVVFAKP